MLTFPHNCLLFFFFNKAFQIYFKSYSSHLFSYPTTPRHSNTSSVLPHWTLFLAPKKVPPSNTAFYLAFINNNKNNEYTKNLHCIV